jgi:hypothetical protein
MVAEVELPPLLEAVGRLQTTSLQHAVIVAIKEFLSILNAIDVWIFAERAALAELEDSCVEFVCERFTEISIQPAFVRLSREMLVHLLRCDALKTWRTRILCALLRPPTRDCVISNGSAPFQRSLRARLWSRPRRPRHRFSKHSSSGSVLNRLPHATKIPSHRFSATSASAGCLECASCT